MVKQLITFLNDEEFEFLKNLKKENKTTWRKLINNGLQFSYIRENIKTRSL